MILGKRSGEILATLFAATVVAGCSMSGQPLPVTSAPATPQQTDSMGRSLPFKNSVRDRWNPSNNGTDYEPCTAFTTAELDELGVASSSIRDAATVDGQSLRGCRWYYRESRDWVADQLVINYRSRAEYLASNPDFAVNYEVNIDGITVGVIEDSTDACFTYIQSGRAAILTSAASHVKPAPPRGQICQRAIALTQLTLKKIAN